jgi:hypothetical protein
MSNKFNIKRNARFLRMQAGLVTENRLSLAGYETRFGIRNTVTDDFFHE